MSQLPPTNPNPTATPALMQFSDLPDELKVRVFASLDRSTLQNACLASKNCNDNAQVALTYSLAEELSRYNHATPGSDFLAFNRKMDRLIERNPLLAIQTLKRIQASPANNTDAIVGLSLLKACLALTKFANAFDPEKVKHVLTTTALEINNLIPPLPILPLEQTQILISFGDKIVDTIFDTLTRMSVGDATFAALHKIPATQVATSGMKVQVEALRKIAKVCIVLGQTDDAQKVIKKIIPLDPNNYCIRDLYSNLCEALVKKGELDQALAIAKETLKDMFTYQTLRSAICTALVERGDFSTAAVIAMTTRHADEAEPLQDSDPHSFRITNTIDVANLLMRSEQLAAHQEAAEILHHMLPEMCQRPSFNYAYYSALKKGGNPTDLIAYSEALPHDDWEYKLEMLIQAAQRLSETASHDNKAQALSQIYELKQLSYNARYATGHVEPTANQLKNCSAKLAALLN